MSSSAHPVTAKEPVKPVAPFAGVSKDPRGAALPPLNCTARLSGTVVVSRVE